MRAAWALVLAHSAPTIVEGLAAAERIPIRALALMGMRLTGKSFAIQAAMNMPLLM